MHRESEREERKVSEKEEKCHPVCITPLIYGSFEMWALRQITANKWKRAGVNERVAEGRAELSMRKRSTAAVAFHAGCKFHYVTFQEVERKYPPVMTLHV
ncbi:hypothetical protein MHYP_G00042610 [Metynnis hypsauchen]